MRVVSSLDDATGCVFCVPERLRGRGLLGELAEQDASVDPVPVPFSEVRCAPGQRIRASI